MGFLDALLVCCLLAFFTWLFGMIRRKPFGAWPAAFFVGLLLIVLVCSGMIGYLEFVRGR
jgi:hypothetical protein